MLRGRSGAGGPASAGHGVGVTRRESVEPVDPVSLAPGGDAVCAYWSSFRIACGAELAWASTEVAASAMTWR